ncbi:hypothetical protein CEXT_301931 [Caerostris extrusa]|uniref:Uncharacterized protein n=1 Tax=Caerostris extrusa TaxID=172846 RepID=A0AAV4VX94_CAEEX|nr:hypothetical protein CEXT_301931 [Caerostris extrusa]
MSIELMEYGYPTGIWLSRIAEKYGIELMEYGYNQLEYGYQLYEIWYQQEGLYGYQVMEYEYHQLEYGYRIDEIWRKNIGIGVIYMGIEVMEYGITSRIAIELMKYGYRRKEYMGIESMEYGYHKLEYGYRMDGIWYNRK